MYRAIIMQAALVLWGTLLSAQIVPINTVGTVTNDMGEGVGGIEVFITAFFSDSTTYLNTVMTGNDGSYTDTIGAPQGETGVVIVSIIDCNGNVLEQFGTWNGQVTTLYFDFNYCSVNSTGDSCGVYIIQQNVPGSTTVLLYAIPIQGNAVSYLWSTGDTSEYIVPPAEGTYCVTIATANGCTASDCYVYVQEDSTDCLVMINPSPNWPPALYAEAYGVPPFTYAWNTGETGPEIAPTEPGTYCVSITDGTGCEASSCFTIDQSICEVIILYEPSGTLTAQGFSSNPMNIFYAWNTGETTQSINPTAEGLYCVTINDNTGCIDSACIYYAPVAMCGVQLSYWQDSSGQTIVAAGPYGAAPFTFNWSTGATTSYITLDSLQPGICVTVTDTEGCEATACTDSLFYSCAAWILVEYANSGATLTAFDNGTPVGNTASYQWSNGETTQSITVTQPGDYCVVIATSSGCTSTACVSVDFNTGGDTCNMVLSYTTTTDSMGQVIIDLSVMGGTPPYTYVWSTGDVTPFVVLPDPYTTVCVTVTDANGCTKSACIYPDPNQCYVTITTDLVDTAVWVLTAVGQNNANYEYTWSNGATAPVIIVTELGTYCVTVTGGGSGTTDTCTAIACISLDSFFEDSTNTSEIAGYVFGLPNAFVGGSVELYQVSNPNNGNNAWELVDSTLVSGTNYYKFANVPGGLYAIKAIPENNPMSPVQYMPTYHYSTVDWQLADLVAIPNLLTVLYDIYLVAGDTTNGTGIISGSITDEEGLLPAPVEEMRSGGIPGILILLHRADGMPVGYTYSDVTGEFTFEGLPFGQYVITFDVPGIASPELWVTIGSAQPLADGLVLSTTKLSSSTHDLWSDAVDIYPVPAASHLTVERRDGAATPMDIELLTTDGKTLARYRKVLPHSGSNAIPVGSFEPGLYLIRLSSEQGQIVKKWIKL